MVRWWLPPPPNRLPCAQQPDEREVLGGVADPGESGSAIGVSGVHVSPRGEQQAARPISSRRAAATSGAQPRASPLRGRRHLRLHKRLPTVATRRDEGVPRAPHPAPAAARAAVAGLAPPGNGARKGGPLTVSRVVRGYAHVAQQQMRLQIGLQLSAQRCVQTALDGSHCGTARKLSSDPRQHRPAVAILVAGEVLVRVDTVLCAKQT